MKFTQRLDCYKILKHFGIDKQTDKPLAEIIQVIADAEIILEQAKEGLGIHEQVSKTIDTKIKRTLERITEGYYGH